MNTELILSSKQNDFLTRRNLSIIDVIERGLSNSRFEIDSQEAFEIGLRLSGFRFSDFLDPNKYNEKN